MNDHCNDDFMYGVCASRGPLGDFICPQAALGGQVSAAGSTQLIQTPFLGGTQLGLGSCLPPSVPPWLARKKGWGEVCRDGGLDNDLGSLAVGWLLPGTLCRSLQIVCKPWGLGNTSPN